MRTLATGLLLSLLCACVAAQGPATGYPVYGSFENGSFDSTNLQDLNTFFQIPIVASAGRGVNFSFAITYNSAMWTNSGYLGAWSPATIQAIPNWGWRLNPSLGNFVYYTNDTGCWYDHETEWGSYTNYSDFAWWDTQGTYHTFNGINWNVLGTGGSNCHVTNGGPETAHADDNSGLFMNGANAIYSIDPTVITPDGTQNNGVQLKDTNGNFYTSKFISLSETDWIDSVGRTALKVITSSTSIQYEYLDPTGAYQTTTVTLSSIPIKTNFGCYGITEYSGTASLPTSVTLPNGQSYTITYEPTPGFSGDYTGRLLRITLPTGGYYEYDYPTTGNMGVNCADGSITNLTRKVNASTPNWTYVRTSISGAGGTTSVTAPVMPWDTAGNTYVYTFNSSGQQIQELDYQGTSTLLRTVNSTYSANGSPATRVTIIPASAGTIQSEVDTTYDNYTNLTQLTEYDWGSASHGSAIRTTTSSYLSGSAYAALNIMNRLAQKTVTVGGSTGTVAYLESVGYDAYAMTICPTGQVDHDDANYGCSFNTRGNPTSVTVYSNPARPSGGVTKDFTYDFFGNLRTAQANCCQLKTFNYSTLTEYSAPDSVISGISSPQLTVSATYNTYTSEPLSSTDENGQVTSYTYDILRRLTKTTRPDGSSSTTCYSDLSTSPCYSTSSLFTVATLPVSSVQSVSQTTSYDALGRPSTVTLKDASNAVYSIIQTSYDPTGRAYNTSNPYTGSPSYWTQTNFDAVGRSEKTILADGSFSTIAYTGSSVGSALVNCATSTDQAGKSRESCADGSGRMTAVLEDPGTSGHFAYLTTYTYNVLDQLTQVTQGAETRTYNYDGIGRITSSITPEGGTVCFGTVSGGACQNNGYDSWNNLTTRTDARGVVTSYSYDSLNRPYQVTYNVGSTGISSPGTVTYTFGTTSTSNNNGRLVSIFDGSGSESYSYDILGRVTQLSKVINGTTYPISYVYNLADELTQITYPSGRVVAQSVDAIGRLCAIGASGSTCSSGTTYASSFAYNTAQELKGFNYGNGVSASFGYSNDRLQLTSLSYSVSGTTLYSLAFNYGSSNNGQIAGITDNVDGGRSVVYTYDALQRLSSAVTNGSTNYPKWGLSWMYDRYGNRTAQTVTAGTAPSNSLSIPVANQISGTGFGYDANGNMTGDGLNTLTYDAENNLISANGSAGAGAYVYDGKGFRVRKCISNCTSPTASTVYIFSGSNVIAEYVNGVGVSSPTREYIYLGSTLLSTIDSTGTKYQLADHLSPRVTTDSSGNVVGQQGHFPYGEQWYAANTVSKWQFTSYERDAESGNDYARARYHINRLGRFASPDPMSGNASDPQSLNRYSYARNMPIDLTDPTGADVCGDARRRQPDRERVANGSSGRNGGNSGELESADAYQDDGCDDYDGGGGAGDIYSPVPIHVISNPAGPDPPDPNDPTLAGLPGICTEIYMDGADMGNTCDGRGGQQGQSTSGGGGGGAVDRSAAADQAKINATLKALVKLLPKFTQCLNFLNSNSGDAVGLLDAIATGNTAGIAVIAPTVTTQGNITSTTVANAETGYVKDQAITVNAIGAFFGGSINGVISLSTNNGRISGGTPGAQAFILLHEAGHLLNVLQPDFGSRGAGSANDNLINKNCGSLVSAIQKGGS